MKKIMLTATLMAMAFSGAAHAERKSKEEVLADYERTGEFEYCIPLQSIDHSKVLDDQTILFVMQGDRAYLNELPHKCPQLSFHESYMYKTSLNRLCNTDIITVLDTAADMRLASCGLGKFEKLTEKEKAE